MYGVSRAYWKTDLMKIVGELRPSVVYALPNQKLPSGSFPHNNVLLKTSIDVLRASKTEKEVRLMRVAIKTSALAHIEMGISVTECI